MRHIPNRVHDVDAFLWVRVMIPFVLMCMRTGNLLVGYRVNLMGDDHSQYILKDGWTVALLEVHGWVVHSGLKDSGFGGFWIYMNAKWVDENFEILGAL